MKKIIFGLGTGRCGTLSLAASLNSCKNSLITHEGRGIGKKLKEDPILLPWNENSFLLDRTLKQISNREYSLVGDIAFYYLPYVEIILGKYPDSKFICMKRNRTDTVNSYMKKTVKRNHWQEWMPKCAWNKDLKWDPCYPKYEAKDKITAISKYWEEYYIEAERLEIAYPNKFSIFDINELNTGDGLKGIRRFIGDPTMMIIPNKKFNVGSASWR